MIRTIENILTDAKESNDLQQLISLWNEIVENKYKYTLSGIYNAASKIAELALSSNGVDFEKALFYHQLKELSIPFQITNANKKAMN